MTFETAKPVVKKLWTRKLNLNHNLHEAGVPGQMNWRSLQLKKLKYFWKIERGETRSPFAPPLLKSTTAKAKSQHRRIRERWNRGVNLSLLLSGSARRDPTSEKCVYRYSSKEENRVRCVKRMTIKFVTVESLWDNNNMVNYEERFG